MHNLVEQVRAAGEAATLPEGFQWGADAMESFNFGKQRATEAILAALEEKHRFGAPPEPVVNPSEAWCDAYAAWYNQEPG